MRPFESLSRRSLLAGAGAAFAIALGGCSRAEPDRTATRNPEPARPAAANAAMTVHRDPNCGCCEAWARQAQEAGFATRVVDEADMASLKRRLGVPETLASCHTATLDGFVIEGHVPFDQVRRLLRDRPAGVRGLAVPGMPVGSPGMEAPDGRREPYQIFALEANGRSRPFARVS